MMYMKKFIHNIALLLKRLLKLILRLVIGNRRAICCVILFIYVFMPLFYKALANDFDIDFINRGVERSVEWGSNTNFTPEMCAFVMGAAIGGSLIYGLLFGFAITSYIFSLAVCELIDYLCMRYYSYRIKKKSDEFWSGYDDYIASKDIKES